MAKKSLKTKGVDEEKNEERRNRGEENNLNFVLSNLEIDRFKLDEEAIKQPELMDKIAKLLPKAKEATARAKNRMEFIETEMAQDIRKNPKNYGLDKTTDTVVYKTAKNTKEYQRAFSSYLFCKKKEDEYVILYENVKSRNFLLKLLGELWLNNYFSSPEVYKTKIKRRKKNLDFENEEE